MEIKDKIKNKEEIEGCVHIIMKEGKPINVFTHINKLPKNGVIHLKGDKIYTFEGFKESHIFDRDELNEKEEKIIITKDTPVEELNKIAEKIAK